MPSTTAPDALSLEDMLRDVLPAVVGLESSEGQGSGFFVASGLLVTNRHVVAGVYELTVRTSDGATHRAKTYGIAQDFDLALVRLYGRPPPHPVLPFVATSEVRVGEEVVAVGSALGLQNTVTRGIVSAIRKEGDLTLIQSDAAINPGNSGGPLVDRRGRVVGVTTLGLKYYRQGVVLGESLGFAISSDHARALLEGRLATTTSAPESEPDPLLALVQGRRGVTPGLQEPESPSASDVATAREERLLEANMQAVAKQAARIDSLWEAYAGACTTDSVSSTTGERPWFGVWDSSSAEALAETTVCGSRLREIRRRADRLKETIERVDDQARRGGVRPGRRREIRSFHRLDW